ncbi:transcription elongation factor [Cryphonectria parasitica EP155]|uniref:Transcription elongation factor n=1 Tax=Cryphonectria parasitica (strain ATCC 38755 / EP155) TaxID=660469 RepID=A0A9P4XVT5_CRYP1|nr:transcription elongation factor [Cryphonectria parasitica EP155]KAF3762204.1 transcription elongation factor [Cryphonectria parasitica EP155]
MDQKKLKDQIDNLKLALQKKEPPSTIVAILKGLEKADSPSEDVLRSTKAGQHIGKLRHDPSVAEEIRGAAKRVVDKWKQAVQSKKHKGIPSVPTRTSTPSTTASPAPPPTPSASKPYQGDAEKRNHRVDNPKTDVTDSLVRNNCIIVMYNGICYQNPDSVETVLAKAVEVEAAAFKHFGGENAEYRAKMRSLFQNLKVKSNTELRRKVRLGEIAATDFIKMTQDELKSQEHKERDKALEKENLNNAQVAQPEKSISDALTCGKCGQKKVSYTQAQTRSADEPMTTFCECLNCGNRWKFS